MALVALRRGADAGCRVEGSCSTKFITAPDVGGIASRPTILATLDFNVGEQDRIGLRVLLEGYNGLVLHLDVEVRLRGVPGVAHAGDWLTGDDVITWFHGHAAVLEVREHYVL